MPSFRCSPRIMLSVRGRSPRSTSYTRVREPKISARSFGASPACPMRNRIASVGRGEAKGKWRRSKSSTRTERTSRRSPSMLSAGASQRRSISSSAASRSASVRIGRIGSGLIPDAARVNFVVLRMGADPLDEDDSSLIVDGTRKPNWRAASPKFNAYISRWPQMKQCPLHGPYRPPIRRRCPGFLSTLHTPLSTLHALPSSPTAADTPSHPS